MQIQRVMVRSRMEDTYKDRGEPWSVPNMDVENFPREDDQFIIEGNRAFTVTLVEWRYDLGEIHLFCIEHPTEKQRRAASASGGVA